METETLTQAQQIFSVFYAIFFGIMLQTIGTRRSNPNKKSKKKVHDITLNLFDTPNAWAIGFRYNNKPFWRFLISILFLNIIPGLIFALVFQGLSYLDRSIGWAEILVIIWISLLPHYIYRFYLAVIVLFKSKFYLQEDEYPEYNSHDVNASYLIFLERGQYKAHSSFLNHITFPFLIVFPSVFILYDFVLLPGQINSIFIYFSWGLLLLALILFIAPREYK
jgi:hypothetical protein